MIAGKHAQASSRDGESFVKTKLSGKVSNGVEPQRWGVLVCPSGRVLQVAIETVEDCAHLFGEVLILQARAQFLLGNLVQHRHCIVIEVLPTARRKVLENLLSSLIPSPPKVAGQPVEAFC